MSKFSMLSCGDSTKKNYSFYLNKYYDFAGAVSRRNITPLYDVEKIKLFLQPYKDSSKIFILNAFKSILSNYTNIKALKTVKYINKIIESIGGVVPNEEKNYQKIAILPKDINNPLRRFLLALYTYQIPRRAMDYYCMEIVESMDDVSTNPIINYLCKKEKKFLFAKYKTAKKYNIQIIPINDELWSEYELYEKSRNKSNNRLLQKEDGSPVDNNQFISYHLNQLLGKGKAVNYLRHYYIKNNLNDEHKKIEEVADKMGHSFSMNNQYFNN